MRWNMICLWLVLCFAGCLNRTLTDSTVLASENQAFVLDVQCLKQI
jgi:hypothetical protein